MGDARIHISERNAVSVAHQRQLNPPRPRIRLFLLLRKSQLAGQRQHGLALGHYVDHQEPRASLPVDFATIYLAPLVAEFARRYPGIAFDIDLTLRRVDVVSEPYDVAIRMGELTDSNLIARLLARFSVRLNASPRYLALCGEPAHPSDLAQHECVGFPRAGKWVLHHAAETIAVKVGGRFLADSIGMIWRLASLDLGVVRLPKEIAAGRLKQILRD